MSTTRDRYDDSLDDVTVLPPPPNWIAEARENTSRWRRKVHAEAKLLVTLGFYVLPIKKLSKGFACKGFNANDASNDPKTIDEWFHPDTGRFAGFNLAIACGRPSGGRGFVVADADRHGQGDGVKEWIDLVQTYGPPEKHPWAKTPNDGEHHLFQWHPAFTRKSTPKGNSGLEVLGGEDGEFKSFILVYPSVVENRQGHRKQYEWQLHPQECQPPPIPDWLAEAFAVSHLNPRPKIYGKGRGNEEMADGTYYTPVPIEDVEAALLHIKPWELDYDNGDPSDGRPSYVSVLQAIHSEHPNIGKALAIRWASGELHGVENSRYEPGEVEKRWRGFNELGNSRGRVSFGTIRMAAKVNGWLPPGEDPDNWFADAIQHSEKGGIKITMSNCIALIRKLPIELTFDEFTQRDYIDGVPVEDDHITKVRVLLENNYGTAFGKDMTCDAMIAVAKRNSFDALKDYVNDLPPPDGEDYINQMCVLMGVDSELERAFIKRQLIGGIARALIPGVKDDTAVVLLGPQGGGKSQFIAALCPVAEWFDDTISGKLSNKDELAKMCGKWMVELAELASLNKGNNDTSKQFMSTRIDRYRSPYGRKTRDFPRRCSVWGSTNNEKHLSDETGNRRFWPVSCPTPMAAATWLKAGNREKVWAQAPALYKADEKWWLNSEEENAQKELAERHRKKGMVEQELNEWWESGTGPFHIEPVEARDAGVEPDDDDVYRRHFVQVMIVQRELKEIMRIPPTIQQVADGLKLIGFVAHPPTPTGNGKATTYQYREGGRRIVVPKGFASAALDAELETLSRSERGKRIIEEINRG